MLGQERGKTGAHTACMPVGFDAAPEREAVRFRALPSRSFPAGTVDSIQPGSDTGKQPTAAEMTVSFMGLIGPGGVLPEHYTDLIMQRLRIKDRALRDFLDLFNHRTISLFHRAWLKYRFQFNYGRYGDKQDAFSFALRCLIGLGSDHTAKRTAVSDETFLFYGGRFASRARPANGLANLLSDHLGVRVTVEQFCGHWLKLAGEECTVLPAGPERSGHYNRLGIDTILGERVWDIQSRFRLRVGPLEREEFEALLPGGQALNALCAITRNYVGAELDFDVQLVLAGEAVIPSRLQAPDHDGAALGWNSWLAGARCGDADDARFHPEVHTRHA